MNRHLILLLAGAVAVGCQKTDSVSDSTPARAVDPAPITKTASDVLIVARESPKPAEPKPAEPAIANYGERTKQFLEAAEKGRISILSELVRQGVNVNDKDDEGQTALHKAAAKGQKSAVVALLVMGADMGERDGKNHTALMIAAEAGREEIVKLLVSPDTVKDLAGDALALAGKELKIDLGKLNVRLSVTGNDARDQADPQGRTALMLAAAGGHTDCVKRLLQSGSYDANRNAVLRADKAGQNSLMLAAAAGHADTLGELVRPYSLTLADLRRTNPAGKTALDLAETAKVTTAAKMLWQELAAKAAAADDVPTLQAALEKYPAELDSTALLVGAATGGAPGAVRTLMDRAKDKSPEEKLRLMNAHAIITDDSALLRAITSGNPTVVRTLLDLTWWKDKDALIRFIRHKSRTGESALELQYLRNNYADQLKLIEERLKEIEGKK